MSRLSGLLTAPPLRQTTVRTAYRDVAVLPYCYGTVTITPIPYSDDNRQVQLADHPIDSVISVIKGKDKYTAYNHVNTTDETGHAIALLDMFDPWESGEDLIVKLRGRWNTVTGDLMTNPADVLYDMAQMSGYDMTYNAIDNFRVDAMIGHMTVNGVLDDSYNRTIDAMRDVCGSCGAIVNTGLPGFAAVWPIDTDILPTWAEFGTLNTTDLSSDASADDIVTVVRAEFDYDHAAQKYLQSIVLEVDDPDIIGRYGRKEKQISLMWCGNARQAESVAKKQLQYYSRPLWTMDFTSHIVDQDIPPGVAVTVSHVLSPLSGTHAVSASTVNIETGLTKVSIESPVGTAPETTVVSLGAAMADITATVTHSTIPGEVTITALDANKTPIESAYITLDTVTKIADINGKATFTAAPGLHYVKIDDRQGGVTEIFDFEVTQ